MSQLVPLQPVITFEGREFAGSASDYEDLGSKFTSICLGGAFSIKFAARWDDLNSWSRIIDFGNGPSSGNIFIANKADSCTLAFHVWLGSQECRFHVHDAIMPGDLHRYLCTVSAAGHMRAYRDGQLIGEKLNGFSPPLIHRSMLYVGKSHWGRDKPFCGLVLDLAVWNAVVTWDGMKNPVECDGEPPHRLDGLSTLQSDLEPVIIFPGREFSGESTDYDDLGEAFGDVALGAGFSVSFTARWDSLKRWSRIIDFGNGPDNNNIFIANRAMSNTFAFHVLLGTWEIRLQIPNAIVLGEVHRYLCTVTTRGRMRVYCDGYLIGELIAGGTPVRMPRRCLYIGKSNWDRDDAFHGSITDLTVWNIPVGWNHQRQSENDEFGGRTILVDLRIVDGPTEAFEGQDWLDSCMRAGMPVAWNVYFIENPSTSCHIALMVFANQDTALFLRTHMTGGFLPVTVMKALLCDSLKKVTLDYDDNTHSKIQENFNIQPVGVLDLAYLGRQKGLVDITFESLAERFCYVVEKQTPSESFSWTAEELTEEQITFAANRAYYSILFLENVQGLPCMSMAKGTLKLLKEWEDQCIVQKQDGLWCTACESGPMSVQTVVEMHIAGQKHRKKIAQPQQEFLEEYLEQGITVLGDKQSTEYRCTICDVGPLTSISLVGAHVRSKKHQKAIAVAPQLSDDLLSQGIIAIEGTQPIEYKCTRCDAGPFTAVSVINAHIRSKKHQKVGATVNLPDGRWNLPDYVKEVEGQLLCGLCDVKVPVAVMLTHLGSDRHAKKCRSSGNEELIYLKKEQLLLGAVSRKPVVRSGFTVPDEVRTTPEKREVPQPIGPTSAATTQDTASLAHSGAEPAKVVTKPDSVQAGKAQHPLPDGWRECVDQKTGHTYYVNGHRSQWERPAEVKKKPAPPVYVLPPGWRSVWNADTNQYYYADTEVQGSQWDPPPPYVHRDWARHVDPEGRAYWACCELELSFYEQDSNHWTRLVDHDGRTYWSNPEKKIRFFE